MSLRLPFYQTEKPQKLSSIPLVQAVLVVQPQQSLVHLWVQGNQVLLAVLGIQIYLADLIDPSALVVL